MRETVGWTLISIAASECHSYNSFGAMRLREGGQIRRNIGAYVVGHELLYGRGSFFRSLERFAMETSLVP